MKKGKQTPQDKRKQTPTLFTPPKRDTKTHHRTGYHKPIKNPTTNAAPDPHKVFCKRCKRYNGGFCPMTGTPATHHGCSV